MRLTFQGRTIFSWYEIPGYEKANSVLSVIDEYAGRIHLLEGPVSREYGQGSINLTNIRESDQGWYECRVIFPDRSPSTRNNGTWFHLSIEGKSRLIAICARIIMSQNCRCWWSSDYRARLSIKSSVDFGFQDYPTFRRKWKLGPKS